MHRPQPHKRNKVFTYWIDIVGTCNLRCPTCPQGNFLEGDFKGARNPTGFMDMALFKEILAKIKRDNVSDRTEIHLYSWGEPLLHPEAAKFVEEIKNAGYFCGLSSNLNLDKSLRDVIKAGPDTFRVSLSGFFQDHYTQTHRRGDIRVVKANMYMLRSFIDQYRKKTAVQVLYHVYRHNMGDDLLMMAGLCDELGFSLDPVWANLMPLEKGLDLLAGKLSDADRETVDWLAVDPRAILPKLAPLRDQDCEIRRVQTTINVDGTVQLCCATFDGANRLPAKSFLDESHDALQAMKYEHQTCADCMNAGYHLYFLYGGGDELDELGNVALRDAGAKVDFRQHAEQKLTLLDGGGVPGRHIHLPRAPETVHLRQKRGLRKLVHNLFGSK